VLALACALLGAAAASAHTRSSSSSSWEIDTKKAGGATALVQVRAAASDLEAALQDPAARLAGVAPPLDEASIDRFLLARFQLLADGTPCAPGGPVASVATSDPSHVARRFRLVCPAAAQLVIRADGFFEVAPGHLHLARVRVDDAPAREHVVVLENRRVPIVVAGGAAAAPTPGLLDYVRLGLEHIATGIDHLVFLAGLLLVGGSLGQVAVVVTGFTLAHSVTLALGVLGVVHPDAAAIEALIGLSIVIVALENFAATSGHETRRGIVIALALLLAASCVGALAGRVSVPAVTVFGIGLFSFCYLALAERSGRPERLRWCVAFAFGLIHGFGFAGALAELALPAGRVAHALFGFNVGVELGQLVVVALAWPVLSLLLHAGGERARLVVQLGSTPVLAAGLYWYLSRALG
jgi:hypothetical protein